MWYIFPQLLGIGRSEMSIYYGIKDINEAKAYLNNYYLRTHTLQLCKVLLSLDTKDIRSVFDSPDDLKLQSCMTLFACARPDLKIFQSVLDKYYGGKGDFTTISMLMNNR